MKPKTMALCLGVITALTIAGCSGSNAGGTAAAAQDSAPQASAQRGGRNGGLAAADPELQQAMQDQQQDQQQLSQLIQQVHTDASLPESTEVAPAQNQPSGGPQRGNFGQGQAGQADGQANGQASGQASGQDAQQDPQAIKDLLAQEHQAATDLAAKLSAFDALVKQATANQKALKDAQTHFAPIEEALPVRSRGTFQGGRGQNGNGGGNPGFTGNSANGNGGTRNGGPRGSGAGTGAGFGFLTQGVQTRIDSYKAAMTKLDVAIAQLKTDLGQ